MIYYIQTDKRPLQNIGPFNDAETAPAFIEKHMMRGARIFGFNAPNIVNKD